MEEGGKSNNSNKLICFKETLESGKEAYADYFVAHSCCPLFFIK